MKTERLLAIIILLLQRKRITAKELAEQLEVSIRTIYRDIESINLAGIPIVSYQGNDGGYEILSSFMLQNQALNINDRNILISSLKGITSLFDDLKMDHMLDTITSAQTKKSRDALSPVIIDFSPWGLPNQHTTLLTLLKKAIEQKREVHFYYVDSSGSVTERKVQPATIIVKAGIPYLYGYCLHREASRLFRVSRMKDAILTANQFQLLPELDLQAKSLEACWRESSKMISLILIFQPKLGVLVEETFTPNQITILETGYIRVECQFPEGDWVTRFLLSFGNQVEIIEPEELKGRIREEAKKIIQMYE
ncbi:helix-turn-helix transcriptional regulator [Bacillus sp. CGMCC 1.16607]|uniref:helix-turn-helix transcriptional regulator n=1 Tax=Bacillus sp. CGMCC 1.16607 TaxID=3351842 RepID=UPI0036338346